MDSIGDVKTMAVCDWVARQCRYDIQHLKEAAFTHHKGANSNVLYSTAGSEKTMFSPTTRTSSSSSSSSSFFLVPDRVAVRDAKWRWLLIKSYVLKRDFVTGYLSSSVSSSSASLTASKHSNKRTQHSSPVGTHTGRVRTDGRGESRSRWGGRNSDRSMRPLGASAAAAPRHDSHIHGYPPPMDPRELRSIRHFTGLSGRSILPPMSQPPPSRDEETTVVRPAPASKTTTEQKAAPEVTVRAATATCNLSRDPGGEDPDSDSDSEDEDGETYLGQFFNANRFVTGLERQLDALQSYKQEFAAQLHQENEKKIISGDAQRDTATTGIGSVAVREEQQAEAYLQQQHAPFIRGSNTTEMNDRSRRNNIDTDKNVALRVALRQFPSAHRFKHYYEYLKLRQRAPTPSCSVSSTAAAADPLHTEADAVSSSNDNKSTAAPAAPSPSATTAHRRRRSSSSASSGRFYLSLQQGQKRRSSTLMSNGLNPPVRSSELVAKNIDENHRSPVKDPRAHHQNPPGPRYHNCNSHNTPKGLGLLHRLRIRKDDIVFGQFAASSSSPVPVESRGSSAIHRQGSPDAASDDVNGVERGQKHEGHVVAAGTAAERGEGEKHFPVIATNPVVTTKRLSTPQSLLQSHVALSTQRKRLQRQQHHRRQAAAVRRKGDEKSTELGASSSRSPSPRRATATPKPMMADAARLKALMKQKKQLADTYSRHYMDKIEVLEREIDHNGTTNTAHHADDSRRGEYGYYGEASAHVQAGLLRSNSSSRPGSSASFSQRPSSSQPSSREVLHEHYTKKLARRLNYGERVRAGIYLNHDQQHRHDADADVTATTISRRKPGEHRPVSADSDQQLATTAGATISPSHVASTSASSAAVGPFTTYESTTRAGTPNVAAATTAREEGIVDAMSPMHHDDSISQQYGYEHRTTTHAAKNNKVVNATLDFSFQGLQSMADLLMNSDKQRGGTTFSSSQENTTGHDALSSPSASASASGVLHPHSLKDNNSDTVDNSIVSIPGGGIGCYVRLAAASSTSSLAGGMTHNSSSYGIGDLGVGAGTASAVESGSRSTAAYGISNNNNQQPINSESSSNNHNKFTHFLYPSITTALRSSRAATLTMLMTTGRDSSNNNNKQSTTTMLSSPRGTSPDRPRNRTVALKQQQSQRPVLANSTQLLLYTVDFGKLLPAATAAASTLSSASASATSSSSTFSASVASSAPQGRSFQNKKKIEREGGGGGECVGDESKAEGFMDDHEDAVFLCHVERALGRRIRQLVLLQHSSNNKHSRTRRTKVGRKRGKGDNNSLSLFDRLILRLFYDGGGDHQQQNETNEGEEVQDGLGMDLGSVGGFRGRAINGGGSDHDDEDCDDSDDEEHVGGDNDATDSGGAAGGLYDDGHDYDNNYHHRQEDYYYKDEEEEEENDDDGLLMRSKKKKILLLKERGRRNAAADQIERQLAALLKEYYYTLLQNVIPHGTVLGVRRQLQLEQQQQQQQRSTRDGCHSQSGQQHLRLRSTQHSDDEGATSYMDEDTTMYDYPRYEGGMEGKTKNDKGEKNGVVEQQNNGNHTESKASREERDGGEEEEEEEIEEEEHEDPDLYGYLQYRIEGPRSHNHDFHFQHHVNTHRQYWMRVHRREERGRHLAWNQFDTFNTEGGTAASAFSSLFGGPEYLHLLGCGNGDDDSMMKHEQRATTMTTATATDDVGVAVADDTSTSTTTTTTNPTTATMTATEKEQKRMRGEDEERSNKSHSIYGTMRRGKRRRRCYLLLRNMVTEGEELEHELRYHQQSLRREEEKEEHQQRQRQRQRRQKQKREQQQHQTTHAVLDHELIDQECGGGGNSDKSSSDEWGDGRDDGDDDDASSASNHTPHPDAEGSNGNAASTSPLQALLTRLCEFQRESHRYNHRVKFLYHMVHSYQPPTPTTTRQKSGRSDQRRSRRTPKTTKKMKKHSKQKKYSNSHSSSRSRAVAQGRGGSSISAGGSDDTSSSSSMSGGSGQSASPSPSASSTGEEEDVHYHSDGNDITVMREGGHHEQQQRHKKRIMRLFMQAMRVRDRLLLQRDLIVDDVYYYFYYEIATVVGVRDGILHAAMHKGKYHHKAIPLLNLDARNHHNGFNHRISNKTQKASTALEGRGRSRSGVNHHHHGSNNATTDQYNKYNCMPSSSIGGGRVISRLADIGSRSSAAGLPHGGRGRQQTGTVVNILDTLSDFVLDVVEAHAQHAWTAVRTAKDALQPPRQQQKKQEKVRTREPRKTERRSCADRRQDNNRHSVIFSQKNTEGNKAGEDAIERDDEDTQEENAGDSSTLSSDEVLLTSTMFGGSTVLRCSSSSGNTPSPSRQRLQRREEASSSHSGSSGSSFSRQQHRHRLPPPPSAVSASAALLLPGSSSLLSSVTKSSEASEAVCSDPSFLSAYYSLYYKSTRSISNRGADYHSSSSLTDGKKKLFRSLLFIDASNGGKKQQQNAGGGGFGVGSNNDGDIDDLLDDDGYRGGRGGVGSLYEDPDEGGGDDTDDDGGVDPDGVRHHTKSDTLRELLKYNLHETFDSTGLLLLSHDKNNNNKQRRPQMQRSSSSTGGGQQRSGGNIETVNRAAQTHSNKLPPLHATAGCRGGQRELEVYYGSLFDPSALQQQQQQQSQGQEAAAAAPVATTTTTTTTINSSSSSSSVTNTNVTYQRIRLKRALESLWEGGAAAVVSFAIGHLGRQTTAATLGATTVGVEGGPSGAVGISPSPGLGVPSTTAQGSKAGGGGGVSAVGLGGTGTVIQTTKDMQELHEKSEMNTSAVVRSTLCRYLHLYYDVKVVRQQPSSSAQQRGTSSSEDEDRQEDAQQQQQLQQDPDGDKSSMARSSHQILVVQAARPAPLFSMSQILQQLSHHRSSSTLRRQEVQQIDRPPPAAHNSPAALMNHAHHKLSDSSNPSDSTAATTPAPQHHMLRSIAVLYRRALENYCKGLLSGDRREEGEREEGGGYRVHAGRRRRSGGRNPPPPRPRHPRHTIHLLLKLNNNRLTTTSYSSMATNASASSSEASSSSSSSGSSSASSAIRDGRRPASSSATKRGGGGGGHDADGGGEGGSSGAGGSRAVEALFNAVLFPSILRNKDAWGGGGGHNALYEHYQNSLNRSGHHHNHHHRGGRRMHAGVDDFKTHSTVLGPTALATYPMLLEAVVAMAASAMLLGGLGGSSVPSSLSAPPKNQHQRSHHNNHHQHNLQGQHQSHNSLSGIRQHFLKCYLYYATALMHDYYDYYYYYTNKYKKTTTGGGGISLTSRSATSAVSPAASSSGGGTDPHSLSLQHQHQQLQQHQNQNQNQNRYACAFSSYAYKQHVVFFNFHLFVLYYANNVPSFFFEVYREFGGFADVLSSLVHQSASVCSSSSSSSSSSSQQWHGSSGKNSSSSSNRGGDSSSSDSYLLGREDYLPNSHHRNHEYFDHYFCWNWKGVTGTGTAAGGGGGGKAAMGGSLGGDDACGDGASGDAAGGGGVFHLMFERQHIVLEDPDTDTDDADETDSDDHGVDDKIVPDGDFVDRYDDARRRRRQVVGASSVCENQNQNKQQDEGGNSSNNNTLLLGGGRNSPSPSPSSASYLLTRPVVVAHLIRTLDLSENGLTTVPWYTIGSCCISLEALYLHGNCIGSINNHIGGGGSGEIYGSNSGSGTNSRLGGMCSSSRSSAGTGNTTLEGGGGGGGEKMIQNRSPLGFISLVLMVYASLERELQSMLYHRQQSHPGGFRSAALRHFDQHQSSPSEGRRGGNRNLAARVAAALRCHLFRDIRPWVDPQYFYNKHYLSYFGNDFFVDTHAEGDAEVKSSRQGGTDSDSCRSSSVNPRGGAQNSQNRKLDSQQGQRSSRSRCSGDGRPPTGHIAGGSRGRKGNLSGDCEDGHSNNAVHTAGLAYCYGLSRRLKRFSFHGNPWCCPVASSLLNPHDMPPAAASRGSSRSSGECHHLPSTMTITSSEWSYRTAVLTLFPFLTHLDKSVVLREDYAEVFNPSEMRSLAQIV